MRALINQGCYILKSPSLQVSPQKLWWKPNSLQTVEIPRTWDCSQIAFPVLFAIHQPFFCRSSVMISFSSHSVVILQSQLVFTFFYQLLRTEREHLALQGWFFLTVDILTCYSLQKRGSAPHPSAHNRSSTDHNRELWYHDREPEPPANPMPLRKPLLRPTAAPRVNSPFTNTDTS